MRIVGWCASYGSNSEVTPQLSQACPVRRRFHAHPGELAVAERFAIDVQRRLVAAACAPSGSACDPKNSAATLRVAATVHTDEAMFIYSQPALLEDDGAQPVQSLRVSTPACAPLPHRWPQRSQRLAGKKMLCKPVNCTSCKD